MSMKLPEIKNVFDVDQENLKDIGLEGLVFDHGSFPTMKLQKHFELVNHPEFDEKNFDEKIMKTLPKFILIDEKDNQFDGVKYSRDGVCDVDGIALEEHMEIMAEAGRTPKLKRYLDVMVQMVNREDSLNKQIIVLSISPTSVGLVSGFLLQLGTQVKDVVVNVFRGVLRKSRSGHEYALWGMKVKI